MTLTALELPTVVTGGALTLAPAGRGPGAEGRPAEAWCSTLVDCCVCGGTHAPGNGDEPGCLATRHPNES